MFFLYFSFLGFFVWDPQRDLFTLPFFNLPITWYGFLFAGGFFIGYYIVRRLFAAHLKGLHFKENSALKAIHLADQLSILVVLGAVLGARLGHVFFYEWGYYSNHPLSIFKVWEGGLASHGGALGILLGLCLFTFFQRKKIPPISLVTTLDALSIPAAFAGGCIRIGNFINQEILGTPTTLPWGVIYLHPVQHVGPIPLHPVQLYEALGYFFISALLFFVWRKTEKKLGLGLMSGFFFLFVFLFRFLIEFLKLPQSEFDGHFILNTGQLLSLPFIILGILLLSTYKLRRVKT